MSKKLIKITFVMAFVMQLLIVGACSISPSVDSTVEAARFPVNEASPEMATALQMIERMPDSPTGYTQVAVLHIQQARRTGNFGLNTKAETAVNRALEIAPQDVPARKLSASLSLTFHRFVEALEKGKQLGSDFPNDAFVFGILTDANAELGNYDDAVAAAQRMVNLKPNSSSYARVAHMRSLFGDHAGSVEAYISAAKATDPKDTEGQSWTLVQLGDEYFKYGKFAEAETAYDEALSILPDYYLALASKGKARAAQNDLEGAEKILAPLLERVPNVESAVLLGDIYSKKGDAEKAGTQYTLAEIMEQKLGVNNDQKRLALMWADQNIRLDEALKITVNEQAIRKDIFTEDALAWCLYRNGRYGEAKESIARAMRIKASDARILYHAGMIEKALKNQGSAVKFLKAALNLNPAFDLIQNESAKQALAELRG